MRILLGMLIATAVVMGCAAVAAGAELPEFYKEISGAVWVVKDVGPVVQAWRGVGLEDVKDRGRMTPGVGGQLGPRLVTGRMGKFGVEILHPEANDMAFAGFWQRHGDGVFAVLHAVPDRESVERETARLAKLGVHVLRTVSGGGAEYTFFDTEPQGKYVLGLVVREKAAQDAAANAPATITHLGLVIEKAAPVSAFWEKLGFPAMGLADASPREDGRYHGRPLLLAFGVGWHRYSKPTLEWIIPPQDPPNCYADFLRKHGEGVQHLGVPVEDLPAAVERYAKLGYFPVQSGAWGDVGKPNSGQYSYMGTEALGGMSIELIHAYK